MDNLLVFSDLIVFAGGALGVLIMIRMVYNFVTDEGAMPSDKAEREWAWWEKVFFGSICAWVVVLSIFINVAAQT